MPIETLNKLQDEKYNYKKFPLSDSNLSKIREVAFDIGGKSYADEMIQKIQEQGYINMAQRYFGLHYTANSMCIGNKAFLETLSAYGFTWIEGKDFPEK